MKVGDIVKETEFKKIVIKAIDEDTGDVLYEHIGKGKSGVKWFNGTLVVEKGR